MKIKEKEAVLFDQWEKNRKGFVFDGVVSEEDYLKSKIKLCFVLKEVNDKDGGGWDLREYIKNGARKQSWDNITRWVKCIRNINLEYKWVELANVVEDERKSFLRSISVMNLKKTPGGYTSIKASFNKVVFQDKEYIQKQYAIYSPDITICCGTGWEMRSVLNLDGSKIYNTNRGIEWFLNNASKPVIIYTHPEARVQDSLLVYGLVDAIREIAKYPNVE